jgi:hypothetical protein
MAPIPAGGSRRMHKLGITEPFLFYRAVAVP